MDADTECEYGYRDPRPYKALKAINKEYIYIYT